MMTRWEAKLGIVLACGLLAFPAAATAQKTLALDPDLLANSDALKVRQGVRTKFGEYAQVSSRIGPLFIKTTNPIFLSFERIRTKQKFSFVIKGAGPETATVQAAQNISSEELREYTDSSHVSIGDEINPKYSNLVATILLDGDVERPWTLILNVKTRWPVLREETKAAFLTDGQRKIVMAPVTSDPPGAAPSRTPALGYEFSEGDRTLGAVQYYGGGIFGANKCIVYLRRDLEPRMRLLLAATMAAILQSKANAQVAYE